MRIAVIGLGALGTEVTLRLSNTLEAIAGSHHVLLVDPDRLEEANVPLSRLYHAALKDCGPAILDSYKASVATSMLNGTEAFRSKHCTWVAHRAEVADVGWGHLRSLDLLISCTDNAMARLETTFAARSLGLPVLDGGVLGGDTEGGRVTCFAPHPDAACYLCGLGEDRRAELLTLASATSLPCTVSPDAAMGSSPQVSASLERTASGLIQELQGMVNSAHVPRRAWSASWGMRLQPGDGTDGWRSERISLRRSASCPWHSGMRLPLVSVLVDQTFRQALAGLRIPFSPRLQFPWPICLLAVCRVCGARDEQARRVALVRRSGVCKRCRSPHQLAPLRTVASVGENDPVAEMTPRQLGWADRPLLQLRRSLVPVTRSTEGQ